jgi:hypothetical protein
MLSQVYISITLAVVLVVVNGYGNPLVFWDKKPGSVEIYRPSEDVKDPLTEIVETELSFISKMEFVKANAMVPLKKILTSIEYDSLFKGFAKVVKTSRLIAAALNNGLQKGNVVQVLMINVPKIEAGFTDYMINYDKNAFTNAKFMMTSAIFKNWEKSWDVLTANVLGHSRDLQQWLMEPYQRLQRYKILLESAAKVGVQDAARAAQLFGEAVNRIIEKVKLSNPKIIFGAKTLYYRRYRRHDDYDYDDEELYYPRYGYHKRRYYRNY